MVPHDRLLDDRGGGMWLVNFHRHGAQNKKNSSHPANLLVLLMTYFRRQGEGGEKMLVGAMVQLLIYSATGQNHIMILPPG